MLLVRTRMWNIRYWNYSFPFVKHKEYTFDKCSIEWTSLVCGVAFILSAFREHRFLFTLVNMIQAAMNRHSIYLYVCISVSLLLIVYSILRYWIYEYLITEKCLMAAVIWFGLHCWSCCRKQFPAWICMLCEDTLQLMLSHFDMGSGVGSMVSYISFKYMGCMQILVNVPII